MCLMLPTMLPYEYNKIIITILIHSQSITMCEDGRNILIITEKPSVVYTHDQETKHCLYADIILCYIFVLLIITII